MGRCSPRPRRSVPSREQRARPFEAIELPEGAINPVPSAAALRAAGWDSAAAFADLQDGRICLTNNAAERALRGIALGRKSWLFAGSDRGGERAAVMYTLIQTARLNDVDPQAWLADVLTRASTITISRGSISCCPGTGRRASQARGLRCSFGIRATQPMTALALHRSPDAS